MYANFTPTPGDGDSLVNSKSSLKNWRLNGCDLPKNELNNVYTWEYILDIEKL